MFGAASNQQSDAMQQQNGLALPQQQQMLQQQQAGPFGSQTSGGSFGQQASSGFGFGSQQQQMQQSQQQSAFSFQQRQPQQEQATPLYSNHQPRSWILEGTPGSALRWEKTERNGGSIPADAVEGGWCTASNKPYYIARCTLGASDKNHTYGYVQASNGELVCHFIQHRPEKYSNFGCTPTPHNLRQQFSAYLAPEPPSSFEVLVNPGHKEELSWVPMSNNPLLFTYPDWKPVVPSNPVTFEDGIFKKVYIGRSIASKGSDSIPGYCSSEKGLTIFVGMKQNGGRVYRKEQPVAFEVLCSVGDAGKDRVEQSYLYDVHYSQTDQSSEVEYVTLASTVLRNNSAEKQKMAWNPSRGLNYEDELMWDIGSPTKHKCEVKAAVPYCPVNDDDNMSIQCTEVGELPPGHTFTNRPNPFGFGGGLGGGFGFGMNPSQPGFDHLVQPTDEDEPGSLLDRTTGYLSLGRVVKRRQVFGTGFANDKPYVVPFRYSIKVGYRGCRKRVRVKFTGKLKTVYGNDCVKDEVVNGMFFGSQITSIARTVSEQLSS